MGPSRNSDNDVGQTMKKKNAALRAGDRALSKEQAKKWATIDPFFKNYEKEIKSLN